MRYVGVVKRISGIFLAGFVSLSAFAVQDANLTAFLAWDSGNVLWAGDGAAAWSTLQLERRGQWLYSYALGTSGTLGILTVQIADNDTLQNVIDRLNTNPLEDFKYIDWGGDWSGHITPYYPSGHVFYGGEDGKTPTGVVMNQGGEMSTVPLSVQGGGYVSDPVVYQGVSGQWQVFPYGDTPGGFMSEFVPNWQGGITDTSSPTTTIDPFFPTASTAGGIGGISSDSGGSGSGGSSSVFESSFTYDRTYTKEVTYEGQTYTVVDVPRTVTTSGGGSGGASFQDVEYDYSGILNSIGGVLQSFAQANIDGISTINDNLRKELEIDDNGELQVAPLDENEYPVDTSELDELQTEMSGWDFSFGMGQNPIGDVFTALIGNPPTGIGKHDAVIDMDIPIFGEHSVHYHFNLSDYIPPAFRSLVLMVVTMLFAIVYMKAISGAFR